MQCVGSVTYRTHMHIQILKHTSKHGVKHTHTNSHAYAHTNTQACTHTHAHKHTDQIESAFIWTVATLHYPSQMGAWVRLAVIIYQLIPKRK